MMKVLTRTLMWKTKLNPRERRKRRRKSMVTGCLLSAKLPFRVNIMYVDWCWFQFPIFQLSKKRVKLKEKLHRGQRLTTASCWECTSTDQIASRTTCSSHTPWWRSMLWMTSLDSMWRKKTGENGLLSIYIAAVHCLITLLYYVYTLVLVLCFNFWVLLFFWCLIVTSAPQLFMLDKSRRGLQLL